MEKDDRFTRMGKWFEREQQQRVAEFVKDQLP